MPLANPNGPRWSRPLVRSAERRLTGVNPILRFLTALFKKRRVSRASADAAPPPGEANSGSR